MATGNQSVVITPRQLQSLPADRVVPIDTRSSWKFLLGHLPGAVYPGSWEDFTVSSRGIRGLLNRDKHFIASKLSALGINHDKILVVYGDPSDKWRTDGRFFWMFEYYGFKNVMLLEGGYDAWTRENLPVERGRAQNRKPSKLTAGDIQFNDKVYADQNWIRERLDSGTITIVDNRERAEFDGATPYGSPRGGHIPHAVHIDWREFFLRDGTLKPRNDLEHLLQQYHIDPTREVVVYCTGGVRSGMAYFVFRYLGYKVRNYDGSWWDWSHNPNLPVEPS